MHENERRPREQHRFPAERRHLLKDEGRRRLLPPEQMLEAAELSVGATVLDVGAGTGFWTAPLSSLVGPSGRVIAVDVEPVMLDELRDLIEERELGNVRLVRAEELRIPLGDAIADAAVLGFVLHEPSDPAVFLREVTRLLKPSSQVLVVDWHKRATEMGPPVGHRLSENEARDLLQAEGFTVRSIESPSSDVYALLAVRP